MTVVARIGNVQSFGHGGIDETKGMAADIHVGNSLGDLRHVSGDALSAGTAGFMMRVLLQRRGVRTTGRAGAVTIKAQNMRRLSQIRTILRSMCVVAGEASNTMRVHWARDEVVALHTIFMRGSFAEMSE